MVIPLHTGITANGKWNGMTNVPGSMLRRTLFWMHLATGLAACFFILVMSVTGALLTYEHQILEAAARRNHVELPAGMQRQSADQLARVATLNLPRDARLTMILDAEPAAPVTINVGRDAALLLHPYTGAVLPDASASWRAFFATIESWHRWLGGEPRSAGANLLDAANLMFLFLVISGSYLWLPAVWRWRTLRGLMLPQRSYLNSKLRDFNWHHVFSFWMLIPLLLIAASGVVMSYGWANNLVYAAYGEAPPQRPAPPGGRPPAGSPPQRDSGEPGPRASAQALLTAAAAQVTDWQRLSLPLDTAPRVSVTAEVAAGGPRPQRRTIVLSSTDATVLEAPANGPAAQSPGQRARVWFRFVHTGEQYGLIGQTLAGLASLAACLLVYTGVALAWRRLIR